MPGSLIKIAETTVSSATASVTLTGINSTYDVYMVKYNNVVPSTDGQVLKLRVTTSGTPDSDSQYDDSIMFMKSDGAFSKKDIQAARDKMYDALQGDERWGKNAENQRFSGIGRIR